MLDAAAHYKIHGEPEIFESSEYLKAFEKAKISKGKQSVVLKFSS
jgi:hypothetical protein